jgi:hypothetical protein
VAEEEWPTTPEGIAEMLARMDAMEALVMTEEEIARWEADRKAQKEFKKSRFVEDAEKCRRMLRVIRFLLDTGIASDYMNRRHGVFERARQEIADGNRRDR